MSRPRTPAAVLELKGAFRKNPKRGEERAAEPQATGRLEAPAQWLPHETEYRSPECARYLAIWKETVAVCWWLTPAEAGPLASYCRLKDKENRNVAKPADTANLIKLYPILGMTQDGRAKFRERGEQDLANAGPKGPQAEGEDWEDIRGEADRLRVV
jgi:hypothetical protein